MTRFFLLWFLSLLFPHLATAIPSPKHDPPGCDTLITVSGKTYLVLIGWQGERELQYQLCDDGSGRVYAIQRDSIRELKRQSNPAELEKTALPAPTVPAPRKYTVPRDTFDLLTLTNGKTYRVVILVRDYLNTYYRLYDDPLDDREYCVPNQQVRSMRVARSHRISQKKRGSGCLVALGILLGLFLMIGLVSIG